MSKHSQDWDTTMDIWQFRTNELCTGSDYSSDL